MFVDVFGERMLAREDLSPGFGHEVYLQRSGDTDHRCDDSVANRKHAIWGEINRMPSRAHARSN